MCDVIEITSCLFQFSQARSEFEGNVRFSYKKGGLPNFLTSKENSLFLLYHKALIPGYRNI
jgi:hypothetical protein